MASTTYPTPDFPDHRFRFWPLTKAGARKSRLAWVEKLRVLCPFQRPGQTYRDVALFQKIFAFRELGAIVTLAKGGPSDWYTLQGRLKIESIFRHLLADRIPKLPPQWVGARSLGTSLFIAIDVDADRESSASKWNKRPTWLPADDQMKLYRRIKLPTEPPKPKREKRPFRDRCLEVEDALNRMGVDPTDPYQALVQITPSGGRHYYVFLDRPTKVEECHRLLEVAGLKHQKGAIEFFPSQTQGFRLPFGHVPGLAHHPGAWLQFIRDFRAKKIRRFSLWEMSCKLDENHVQIIRHRTEVAGSQSVAPGNHSPFMMGVPKHARKNGRALSTRENYDGTSTETARETYQRLIDEKIKSPAEVDLLWKLGIQVEGTRVKALLILAEHLIWFRHLDVEEAERILVEWAYDPRHQSKDIRKDLAKGTRTVEQNIHDMVHWCWKNKKTKAPSGSRNWRTEGLFAPEELEALRPSMHKLWGKLREQQARLYLNFLRFAKLHGQAADDQSGWQAAPAVNAVMRKWTGGGKIYKDRLFHAEMYDTMKMVKEKWQSPNGKGRARTYQIMVPVVSETEWTLSFDDALKSLCAEAPVVAPVEKLESGTGSPTGERDDRTSIAVAENRDDAGEQSRGDHSTNLRSPGSGVDLDPSPRERTPEPDELTGVSGAADEHLPADERPQREREQSCPQVTRGIQLRKRIQDTLRDPREKHVLLNDRSRLSQADQSLRDFLIAKLGLFELDGRDTASFGDFLAMEKATHSLPATGTLP